MVCNLFVTERVSLLRSESDTSSVLHLRLTQPKKLNALTPDTLRDVIAATEVINSLKPPVKVVVISGEGRALCAGADIHSFRRDALPTETGSIDSDVFDLGRRFVDSVAGIHAVTVAQCHGHVVGGGLLLAAACDLRIAARDTQFAVPELNLGIPLGWGGIPRLCTLIGVARTKDVVLTGRKFSADDADEWGFLSRAPVAADHLEGTVAALVASIDGKAEFTLRVTKKRCDALATSASSFRDASELAFSMQDPECQRVAMRYIGKKSRL